MCFFSDPQERVLFLVALSLLTMVCVKAVRGHTSGSAAPSPISVISVRGDVSRPGVYVFNGREADVREALQRAGLDRPERRWPARRVLAEPVASGREIRVSCAEDEPCRARVRPADAALRLALGKPLDLNRASEADLLLIPGMKPDVASAIVRKRREHAWKGLDQLQSVRGVGPKSVERWSPYLEIVDSRI